MRERERVVGRKGFYQPRGRRSSARGSSAGGGAVSARKGGLAVEDADLEEESAGSLWWEAVSGEVGRASSGVGAERRRLPFGWHEGAARRGVRQTRLTIRCGCTVFTATRWLLTMLQGRAA
ncbi:putative pollen-specific leucine-rich repeat extensin-like protein 3 [Iris pallida]|uniref:Pollen-specific leucine-rich repeat extensin-like protein 3 n=1 Tax=Iris pallida TaxID=29817 RepID=A0AAX6HYI2_IRIPA|nr:putative pollen-specific leucine-rich repeat extensin-like protein 3 [Iris pallida]